MSEMLEEIDVLAALKEPTAPTVETSQELDLNDFQSIDPEEPDPEEVAQLDGTRSTPLNPTHTNTSHFLKTSWVRNWVRKT